MLKKKIILMILLSAFTVSAVSCGGKNKDIESSSVSLVESVPDNNDTENTDNTSSIDEDSESSATEPDESSDSSDAESDGNSDNNDENSDDDSVSADGMTNKEMLRMINAAFGIYSDETFEDDLESAILWNMLPEETELKPNDTVTPEFFITVTMRATGYVDLTASLDTVLECAVERKVIETADISAVDLNNAQSIVDAAQFAWLFPDFQQ